MPKAGEWLERAGGETDTSGPMREIDIEGGEQERMQTPLDISHKIWMRCGQWVNLTAGHWGPTTTWLWCNPAPSLSRCQHQEGFDKRDLGTFSLYAPPGPRQISWLRAVTGSVCATVCVCVRNIICIVRLRSWTVSPKALGGTEWEILISSLTGLRDRDAHESKRRSLDGGGGLAGPQLPPSVVRWGTHIYFIWVKILIRCNMWLM